MRVLLRGHSLTVFSVWGDLISFRSVLVFSPALLSLLFLLPYYYYYYYYYYYCFCFYYYIGYYCYHYFQGASGSVWRVLGLGLGMAGRARGWLRVGCLYKIWIHLKPPQNKSEKVCLFQCMTSSFVIFTMTVQVIIAIIIHWTRYLFSDWPKAYCEFLKSTNMTS